MKKTLHHLRNRILTGFIFLLPLFAIVLLLKKLWSSLTGAGNYLVQLLGLKAVLGTESLPVATSLLLLLLFYVFGWLVKFSSLKRVRDGMENLLLKYIPPYRDYKNSLQEKLYPREDTRIPVWVHTLGGERPGLLIDEKGGEAIVFLPNCPDSESGEVVKLETFRVSKLEMNASSFLKCMHDFGKDLMVKKEPA